LGSNICHFNILLLVHTFIIGDTTKACQRSNFAQKFDKLLPIYDRSTSVKRTILYPILLYLQCPYCNLEKYSQLDKTIAYYMHASLCIRSLFQHIQFCMYASSPINIWFNLYFHGIFCILYRFQYWITLLCETNMMHFRHYFIL
jgi:hypothetical protein